MYRGASRRKARAYPTATSGASTPQEVLRTRAAPAMNPPLTFYSAHAIADDRGTIASPGAVLVRHDSEGLGADVVEAGDRDRVVSVATSESIRRCDLGEALISPGFVNAHTHLDLTCVGPRAYSPEMNFADWLTDVRLRRPVEASMIAASVRRGIELSLRGGVVAVGDIVGAMSLTPVQELRSSPMLGASFMECFGLGDCPPSVTELETILQSSVLKKDGVQIGLQPHAPYSAGRVLYQRVAALAAEHEVPVSTHLAESLNERRLIVSGEGPIRDFLESMAMWSPASAAEFRHYRTPVQHVRDVLSQRRWLVAHLNDCSDEDIEILESSGAVVAYCPRSSAYFSHELSFGPHRYQDMVDAGITVALGTDSIIGIPQDASDRMSILDEMRALWRRDQTPPHMLWRMATTAGAEALELPPEWFRLSTGRCAGLVSIDIDANSRKDPLEAALDSPNQPRLLTNESYSR